MRVRGSTTLRLSEDLPKKSATTTFYYDGVLIRMPVFAFIHTLSLLYNLMYYDGLKPAKCCKRNTEKTRLFLLGLA